MSEPGEAINDLCSKLESHAEESANNNSANRIYAENVRERIDEVRALIDTRRGAVKGVAISWMQEMQPIAEVVFGQSLEGRPIGSLREYTPTVFDGILGRTCILSTDEMFGPTLSLDLAAADSLPLNAQRS